MRAVSGLRLSVRYLDQIRLVNDSLEKEISVTTKFKSLAAVLAVLCTASPAFAGDRSGAYAGLEGGLAKTSTTKLDVNTTPAVKDGIAVKHKEGYTIGAFLGYDFGPFRAEIEYIKSSNTVSRADTTVLVPTKFFAAIPGTPVPAPTTAKGAFPDATGKTNSRAIMANMMVDVGPSDSLHGFLGAGIGGIQVRAKQYSVAAAADFLDDKDGGLAWQLFAGLRAPISSNIEAGIKYRYLRGSGLDMVDTLNRKVSTNYVSHGVLASVGVKF